MQRADNTFTMDEHVDRATQNDVPRVTFVSFSKYCRKEEELGGGGGGEITQLQHIWYSQIYNSKYACVWGGGGEGDQLTIAIGVYHICQLSWSALILHKQRVPSSPTVSREIDHFKIIKALNVVSSQRLKDVWMLQCGSTLHRLAQYLLLYVQQD